MVRLYQYPDQDGIEPFPFVFSNTYYDATTVLQTGASTSTGFAHTANTLYATPFYVPSNMTFNQVAIEVGTAVASSGIRVGVGTVGVDGYPLSLLLDSGAIATTTTGSKTATISITLATGWYYTLCTSDGAIAIRGYSSVNTTPFGYSVMATATRIVTLSKAFTAGVGAANALPASLTGTWSATTGLATMPSIRFRTV